ncbi:hypothetical protein [[Eubacterium] cellulosolvens]
MKSMEWKKPTISVFREKADKQEHEPFAVIKAQKISLKKTEKHSYDGEIIDFFVLMGDIDCITSDEGIKYNYVLCWFDDNIVDFSDSFRKLSGVTFLSAPSYTESKGKRTYRSSFKAKYGLVS